MTYSLIQQHCDPGWLSGAYCSNFLISISSSTSSQDRRRIRAIPDELFASAGSALVFALGLESRLFK
jgi:hypothetical protein